MNEVIIFKAARISVFSTKETMFDVKAMVDINELLNILLATPEGKKRIEDIKKTGHGQGWSSDNE